MILTVGSSGLHGFEAYKAIENHVRELGEEIVLFRQDLTLEGEIIEFAINNSSTTLTVTIDGTRYNADEFDTIFWMHPMLPEKLLRFEPYEHARFIWAQFGDLRHALWYVFRNKQWINDPVNAMVAENKIYQLELASSVGLKLPNTIITSNPEAVRDFYEDNDRNIICKFLGPSPILDHVIFTTKLTKEHMKKIDTVKLSPSIFQENVIKSHELRITVVGENIFVTKIFSQEDPQTAIDWRTKPKLNDFEVPMEVGTLPADVEMKVRAFMKKIGLRYGSIDMIVTPDNEHVFLEINPSGQWYFVQVATKQNIAGSIAELLVQKECV